MATEENSQLSQLSPKDKEGIQKNLDHSRENGTLKATHKWTGLQGKTLWDWLQLLGVLAIPLVVAGATLFFGMQQANLADLQHQQDQTSALDQQRAAILQTYIDNIQDLLLNHNLLKASSFDVKNPYHDIAILARARTLTALQGLDPVRKGRLVQFIYDARLIGFLDDKNNPQLPIILLGASDLSGFHFSGVDLTRTHLSGAYLSGAYLPGAHFTLTDLSGADLNDAFLSHATLLGADLSSADLSNAVLASANLSFAKLIRADLSNADLSNADLSYAIITQKQLDQVKSCLNAILSLGVTCHHNQSPP